MEELFFEGKRYISSRRAAQISGYVQDYIGQMCRRGELDARMVGRNWYISEDSLHVHVRTHVGIDTKLVDGAVAVPMRVLEEEAGTVSSHVGMPNIPVEVGGVGVSSIPSPYSLRLALAGALTIVLLVGGYVTRNDLGKLAVGITAVYETAVDTIEELLPQSFTDHLTYEQGEREKIAPPITSIAGAFDSVGKSIERVASATFDLLSSITSKSARLAREFF
ncbi:MAG: hypothetical protein Q7S15_01055, partial [bacterium]|nr:hypothetical protein [bacterium]